MKEIVRECMKSREKIEDGGRGEERSKVSLTYPSSTYHPWGPVARSVPRTKRETTIPDKI